MKALAIKLTASGRRHGRWAERFAEPPSPQPCALARTAAWAGALTGALLALVFFSPAAWLAQGLAEVSQGRLLLAAPRGTLWRGSAELVLSGGTGSREQMRLPGRLHWTLSPQRLSPGMDLSLRADCCTPEPVLRLAQSGWQVQVADSAKPSVWPTALLAGLGTPWNTLQPSSTTGTRLSFAGEASAEPGLETVLDNFLNVVGRRDGPRGIITLGPAS